MYIFFERQKFRNIINYFNIGTNDKGISVKNIVKIMLSERKLKKNQSIKKNYMDGREMSLLIGIPQKKLII